MDDMIGMSGQVWDMSDRWNDSYSSFLTTDKGAAPGHTTLLGLPLI